MLAQKARAALASWRVPAHTRRVPYVWLAGFVTMIVLAAAYRDANVKNGRRYGNSLFVRGKFRPGVENVFFDFFGSVLFRMRAGLIAFNLFNWLPGMYVELSRGHTFAMLVFLLTFLARAANSY